MFKNFLFLLLMIFSFSAFSQEEPMDAEPQHYKIQIGLNVTDAVTNLINVADNAQAIDPYSFSFNLTGEKQTIRMGFKIKYKKNSTDLFPSNNTRNVLFVDFQMRAGIKRTKQIYKKLDLFWGFDVVGGYENDISESFSGSDKLKNTEFITSLGIGPVLGFEYNFAPRFSISTYSSLYYVFSYQNSELKEVQSDNLLDASNSYIHEIEHILPNAIYFHYRF